MAGTPMLAVEDIDVFYGRAQILHGVSFAAREGEIVALAGRNGAGKSTTLKAIIGLVPPSSGRIAFEGRDIAGLEPYRIARQGVGYVPEERRIFTDLSVAENLEVGARPATDGREPFTKERLIALFPNLGRSLDRSAGQLSGGEQQMLTIARTLMGNPRLILIDEPSEGLAPVIVEEMAKAMLALKQQKLTMIVSEQNLAFLAAIADSVVLLERGVMRHFGPMAGLMADEELRMRYLAVS
ncbi:MAG: ABC transporter ATP-binding protein [Hyphomicrobiales bacterium]